MSDGATAPAGRARTLLAAGVALALLAVVALVVLLASGDDASGERGDTMLAWKKAPVVFTPETLPQDRTITGEVLNDTLRKVRVRAKKMVVVDADGRRFTTAALFLQGYSHALYPPLQRPPGADDSTQARLAGEYADLGPRQSSPLTVSWRTTPEMKPPLRLEYDGGSLPIDGA